MDYLEKYQIFLNENKREKNIDDAKINGLILRYACEEATDYAILIKGEWGVGKTFLVKNSIIPYLKQNNIRYKDVIYISLYGIKDLQELENRMMNCIIERHVKNNKVVKKLTDYSKILVDSLNEKTLIINSIKFFQEISNYMWIFDDIERINFAIMDLFGCVNELVEHKNVKVLLIANDMKLSENHTINNNQYGEMKEKIIGQEICYTPNLRKVIEKICQNEEIGTIKKIIKRNKNMLVNTMKKFRCKNLRTLKFCIFNLKIICNQVEESQLIQKDTQFLNNFIDKMFEYLMHICILYRGNNKLFDWSNLMGYTGMISLNVNEQNIEIFGFRFIDDLVKDSIISIKSLEKMYISYKKQAEYKLYQKGSAYDIVTNFAGREDSLVVKGIEKMNIEIRENLHDVELYNKILRYLLELKSAGYNATLIDDVIINMENNIKNYVGNERVCFIPFSLFGEKNSIEFEKTFSKWKKIMNNRVIDNRKNEFKKMITLENFGNSFYEYCKRDKYQFQTNKSFFSSIDTRYFLYLIKSASSSDILNCIRGINFIDVRNDFIRPHMQYEKENKLKYYYKNDLKELIQLKDGIIKLLDENMEIGKRYLIKKLISCVESWIVELEQN